MPEGTWSAATAWRGSTLVSRKVSWILRRSDMWGFIRRGLNGPMFT